MRIYVPVTAAELAQEQVAAGIGHAVTRALRAASEVRTDQASEEDLEVSAFLAAADAAVERLSTADVPLRVVLAVDLAAATEVGDEDVTAVEVPALGWSDVVSIHVDDPSDPSTRSVVRDAVGGDEEAAAEAAELDLLWYDVSERADLLALIGSDRIPEET